MPKLSFFSAPKSDKKILQSDRINALQNNYVNKHIETLKKHQKIVFAGSALVIASFTANILNYIFTTYAERILSFSDFSLIGLVGGFLSLASILFGAYTFTVNYTSSFLIGKYGNHAAHTFWKHTLRHGVVPSILIAVLWFALIPFLMPYFHTNNAFLFVFFGLILLFGFANSANQGMLSAKLLFGSLAVLGLLDPVVKLLAAFNLTFFGQQEWMFVAMILSYLSVTVVSFVLLRRHTSLAERQPEKPIHTRFPKHLFFLSLLSGISSVAYFTFDILLAKHFLSPTQAGQYTLVSLVGKMVFFLGSLTSPFITPFVSRYEGAGKNTRLHLYFLIGITSFFSFAAFFLFGVLGYFTLPILYGEKAFTIVPYIPNFTFGMACYTISSVFVNYYLVKKVYSFTVVTSLLVIVQVGLIYLFHDSVGTIATVMSYVLAANLFACVLMHLFASPIAKKENFFISSFKSGTLFKKYTLNKVFVK